MRDMAESAKACRKLDLLLKVGLLKWGQVGRRSRLGSGTSTRDTGQLQPLDLDGLRTLIGRRKSGTLLKQLCN